MMPQPDDPQPAHQADAGMPAAEDDEAPSLQTLLTASGTTRNAYYAVTEDDMTSLDEKPRTASRLPADHTQAHHPRLRQGNRRSTRWVWLTLLAFVLLVFIVRGLPGQPEPRVLRPTPAPTSAWMSVTAVPLIAYCITPGTSSQQVACERYSITLAALERADISTALNNITIAINWDPQFGDAYCLRGLLHIMGDDQAAAQTDLAQCVAHGAALPRLNAIPQPIYTFAEEIIQPMMRNS